eukprot:scaffold149_cov315-Pinguiococcus_pyrenoidosus.AAC.46
MRSKHQHVTTYKVGAGGQDVDAERRRRGRWNKHGQVADTRNYEDVDGPCAYHHIYVREGRRAREALAPELGAEVHIVLCAVGDADSPRRLKIGDAKAHCPFRVHRHGAGDGRRSRRVDPDVHVPAQEVVPDAQVLPHHLALDDDVNLSSRGTLLRHEAHLGQRSLQLLQRGARPELRAGGDLPGLRMQNAASHEAPCGGLHHHMDNPVLSQLLATEDSVPQQPPAADEMQIFARQPRGLERRLPDVLQTTFRRRQRDCENRAEASGGEEHPGGKRETEPQNPAHLRLGARASLSSARRDFAARLVVIPKASDADFGPFGDVEILDDRVTRRSRPVKPTKRAGGALQTPPKG